MVSALRSTGSGPGDLHWVEPGKVGLLLTVTNGDISFSFFAVLYGAGTHAC